MHHTPVTDQSESEGQIREIASIFAIAILRLRSRSALPQEQKSLEMCANTSPASLDVSDETVLTVIHSS